MNLRRLQDMANIPPRLSGLDGMVYISGKVARHKPRLKYKYQGEEISVFIETESIAAPKEGVKMSSKVLSKLYEWIRLNKDNLLKHWENSDEYTSAEFFLDMKKV